MVKVTGDGVEASFWFNPGVATQADAERQAREFVAAKEALEALKALVRLHAGWDKGTAYIPVRFMHENNAAIAAARAAIAAAEGKQ